jgi:hypothetical protein
MQKVWIRLIRFLTWNFVFALFPLLISWVFRRLGDVPAPEGAYAPELLFFALMISATAMGDIVDETRVGGTNTVFLMFRSALLVGVVTSAIFYGAYTFDQIYGVGVPAVHASNQWC